MRTPVTIARAVTVLALVVAAPLAAAAPAVAQPRGGCTPDVYFELDANGFVTAYPRARCATNGTYKKVTIDASLEVDGTPWIDRSSTSYLDREGGVLAGVGVRGRNGEGSNLFCAITTVGWTYTLSRVTESRTGRNCSTF